MTLRRSDVAMRARRRCFSRRSAFRRCCLLAPFCFCFDAVLRFSRHARAFAVRAPLSDARRVRERCARMAKSVRVVTAHARARAARRSRREAYAEEDAFTVPCQIDMPCLFPALVRACRSRQAAGAHAERAAATPAPARDATPRHCHAADGA